MKIKYIMDEEHGTAALTKGKLYDVVHDWGNNYVIIEDDAKQLEEVWMGNFTRVKSDGEIITEMTHALNELYEKVDNFMPVLEQLYYKGEVHTGQFEDLRAVFKQANRVLGGN